MDDLNSDLSDKSSQAPLLGAIDLGTHTCRLLIGQPINTQKCARFSLVNSFSRVIRLGEGLPKNNPLSQDAMERGLSALEECARRLSVYGVTRVRCVGTEACRKASNITLFSKLIRERTGLFLDVISAQEEASLALAGCWDLFNPKIPYVIVFDIGGGSTEVVLANIQDPWNVKVLDGFSFPHGILSLREPIVKTFEKKRIRTMVSQDILKFVGRNDLKRLIAEEKVQLIGASGTVTTLASILMNLRRFDRSRVHGFALKRQEVGRLMEELWAMDRSQRIAHPCIGLQRTDFLMGGVAIFQGIFDVLDVPETLVANRGVRDGLLYTMLHKTGYGGNCPFVELKV